MSWSYEKLWILLVKKKIKKSQLVKTAGISTNALAQMSKNEDVTMKSIGKLCDALDCKVEDIIEWIPEKK